MEIVHILKNGEHIETVAHKKVKIPTTTIMRQHYEEQGKDEQGKTKPKAIQNAHNFF